MQVLPAAFRIASRARGARAFHPRGKVWHASWSPGEVPALRGSPLLDGPRPALLRVSHAIGLPPTVPDIIGWAVRVVDAHGPGRHQDLLLASSGTGQLTRHLLLPAQDLGDTPFSTLLPYQVAGAGTHVIVARAEDPATVAYAAAVGPQPHVLPRFTVQVGGFEGPTLATVIPGALADQQLGESLRYDPWNTGPELEPAGWPNRIRRPTYAASQEGRGARS